ncbi:MAG: BglII/BstYI family type II restriction endonuclease [Verrucomicrobiota bacterium]
MFNSLREKGFEILAEHHAEAILQHDMPEAIDEIEKALLMQEFPVVELIRGGGGEGKFTQRLRKSLSESGLNKHNFEVLTTVDGVAKESRSHEVDHVKAYSGGTLALEIEWNNKDPFFDRDLENFKRLHAEGAISVGVIITRGRSLHDNLQMRIERFAVSNGIFDLDALSGYYVPTLRQRKNIERSVLINGDFARGWSKVFVADKFGEATTHWRKLEDRIKRGVGNPCPLLLIGLPDAILKD